MKCRVFQQTIQVRDIVKVNDGPHKDFQGEVKYVYRGFAFLSCKMVVENGGIIVCRTKQLQLAGGGKVKRKYNSYNCIRCFITICLSKAAADSLGGFGGFGGGFVPRSPRISSPAREAGKHIYTHINKTCYLNLT